MKEQVSNKKAVRYLGVFLFIAAVCGVVVFGVIQNINTNASNDTVASSTQSTSTVVRQYQTAQTAPELSPARLLVPSIGVDAEVEPVGINEQGNMGVPQDYRNVSWYEPGYWPGESGNAVLAGHLDWDGNPGVFWELETLQAGDVVQVRNENGRVLSYIVMYKEVYDYQSDVAEPVFGSQGQSQLKLITCDGNFLDSQETYQDRYVVTARLITPIEGEDSEIASTTEVEVSD